MLSFLKNIFTSLWKSRLSLVFSFCFILILLIALQELFFLFYPKINISKLDPDLNGIQPPIQPEAQERLKVPPFCQVTQSMHELNANNQPYTDPSNQILEDLLNLITFNPTICPPKKNHEHAAIILVNSARHHYKQRQLIRQTWGSIRKHKKWRLVTLFLMGQSDYCLKYPSKPAEEHFMDEDDSLMEEHGKYGDTIIGAFSDSPRNLTYKHLMGYKFVNDYCPNTDWIIKTDDDVFVNLPQILDTRSYELDENWKEKPSDIYCIFMEEKRSRNGDMWHLTKDEWPYNTFPIYCLGKGYGISMEWLQRIYSVRQTSGFLWVDDLFIMGKMRTIAQKSYNENLKMWNIKENVTMELTGPDFVQNNCKRESLRLGLFVSLEQSSQYFKMDMECLWEKSLVDSNVNAIVVEYY